MKKKGPVHSLRAITCVAALLLAGTLAGCAVWNPPPAPQRFDLGAVPAPADPLHVPAGPVLALDVQAGPALDGTAMSYRLTYADPLQLRAYRDARWTAPVVELLEQRLRAALASACTLLPAGEVAPRTLHLEVQEMSQAFDRPGHSVGLLRLRATLLQRADGPTMVLAQREGQWQAEAPTADAPGGAHALQLATDAAARDLAQWLFTYR